MPWPSEERIAARMRRFICQDAPMHPIGLFFHPRGLFVCQPELIGTVDICYAAGFFPSCLMDLCNGLTRSPAGREGGMKGNPRGLLMTSFVPLDRPFFAGNIPSIGELCKHAAALYVGQLPATCDDCHTYALKLPTSMFASAFHTSLCAAELSVMLTL
jgi:hypothetical protein